MNRHIGQTHEDTASKLPERGTGLEEGTAREERGKGIPLTDEERAKRHETKPPEGYVDIVVDRQPVRRLESYQEELQKKTTPTTAQERGEFYRNRK